MDETQTQPETVETPPENETPVQKIATRIDTPSASKPDAMSHCSGFGGERNDIARARKGAS